MSEARLNLQEDLSLTELVNELAAQRRIDLRGYKHGTLRRRLRRRMQQVNISRYADYLRRVQEDPAEVNELLNTVLINVTEFFRDPQAWEILHTHVFPTLLQGLRAGEGFRAWCAGCASGEEPYSLAILLADYLDDNLPERDIKIYATDTDEEALNIARRAEYAREHLRRVRPEWREKYFYGTGSRLRLNRELRRMVIFGKGNVLSDAPISHCNLIVCRNLLIYFDVPAQLQILKRLQYGLEAGGVLFLGKAETRLGESSAFRPVNARWRIFQKVPTAAAPGRSGGMEATMADPPNNNAGEEQARIKELEQRSLLETLASGVIVLDGNDTVKTHNDGAMRIWGLEGSQLTGRRIHDTEITSRCPELVGRFESVHREPKPVEFHCRISLPEQGDRLISVKLKPMVKEDGQRVGIMMHCEDITPEEKLKATVEQLESTTEELHSSNEELETANEELQSTNEELETTNEELQSTNEELETTNEELQSTNEELETANEELQSLNEELENMNEELEHRTRDLNQLTDSYAETLRSMPFPVMLVDSEGKIQLWNTAAQKLFGVSSTSVTGVELSHLPAGKKLLDVLARRCQAVLERRRPSAISGHAIKETGQALDIHLTPVVRGDNSEGVLLIFAPAKDASHPRGPNSGRNQTAKPAKKKAASNSRKSSRSKRQ